MAKIEGNKNHFKAKNANYLFTLFDPPMGTKVCVIGL